MIAPSILSADFAQLGAECQRMIEYGADWLHVDIMDGHFVPNLTIGAPVVKSIRSHLPNAYLDCHLMVSNPGKWVKDFAKAGASSFNFHFEATEDPAAIIESIRSTKMEVGMAIKPGTSVYEVKDLLPLLDYVLVMTVEPGFGGQSLISSCIEKVKLIREIQPSLRIQVDGGVTLENLPELAKAGADVFVAGTLIFGSGDPRETIAKMKNIVESNK